MLFALDTNTLIYFLRGQGEVAARLRATAPGQVAIPAVVLYELEVGLLKASRPESERRVVDRITEALRVLPFDEKSARAAAAVRTQLENAGTPIGPYDTLIAGTVLAHKAVLVTHKTREFARVPHLQVADWY